LWNATAPALKIMPVLLIRSKEGIDEMSVDKISVDKMSDDEMSVNEMLVQKMLFD
jgi:hypothetical protein